MARKLTGILLCVILVLSAPLAMAEAAPAFAPGVYTATAQGHNANFDIEVTFSEDAITDIDVSNNNETLYLGKGTLEKIKADILENQTVKVDVITGATVSSYALIYAVRDAVKQAGVDPETMPEIIKAEVSYEDATTQVVVVGSGTAGLAAAVEASEQGLDVILVEQLGVLGGSSVRAGYLMSGGSQIQIDNGIEYTEDDFVAYMTDVTGTLGGGNRAEIDPGLFLEESAIRISRMADDNVNWLADMGVGMSVAASNPGTIRGANQDGPGSNRIGYYLVSTLHNVMDERGIDYRMNTRADEIIIEDGKVAGVLVTAPNGSQYTIHADNVIVTTGGYNASQDMIAIYQPAYVGYTSDVSKGADGSGMLMVERAGGILKYMDQMNFHSFTVKYRGASRNMAMSNGAIAVNKEGKRFVNEDTYYDKSCCDAILAQTGGVCYVVFDQSVGDVIFTYSDLANNPDMFHKADTIEELAAMMEVDAEALLATVETYRASVESGVDEELGRGTASMRTGLIEGPFYGAESRPELHTDHGGVVIDIDTRVLDANDVPIPGLFAAGEVAATHVMGSITNTPALAQGRIAAQTIAEDMK